MKKIPSVFVRDWEGNRSLVTQEPNPDCAWIFEGEGVATKKFDGTCVYIHPISKKFFKRYDAKMNKDTGVFKEPPAGFIPAQPPDRITGHWPGWVPVTDAPEDARHVEAYTALQDSVVTQTRMPSGTFELVGPKVNGNPEGLDTHMLIKHGEVIYPNFPRTYQGMFNMLNELDIEGVVWWRVSPLECNALTPVDMAKIKKSDFGLERKPK